MAFSTRRSSLLIGRALSTFALARSSRERLSAIAFVAQFVLRRFRGQGRRREGLKLLLRGIHFVLGPGELEAVIDVVGRGCYEDLPEFSARTGWTVWDVGANVGAFSLLQAARGAQVVAFEPNPECFRRLTSAIGANRFEDRVTAINVAIGEAAGSARLAVPGRSTLLASIVNDWSNRTDVVVVPIAVECLDNVLERTRTVRIDLLKIDAEGAEASILKGGPHTLRRSARVVLEYHSDDELQSVRRQLLPTGFRERSLVPGEPVGGIAYYVRDDLTASLELEPATITAAPVS